MGKDGNRAQISTFPLDFFQEMLLQQKGAGGGAGGGIGGGAGGGGGGGSVEAERKALEAPVELDDGSMHGSYGSYGYPILRMMWNQTPNFS